MSEKEESIFNIIKNELLPLNNNDVFILTHETVIKRFRKIYLNLSIEEAISFKVDNAEIIILENKLNI